MGFKRVAVTVAGVNVEQINEIRHLEGSLRRNMDLLIFSVCNTCVKHDAIKHIAEADLVSSGASNLVRKEVGKKALMQIGVLGMSGFSKV